jgi:ribosomal protein S20
MTDFVDKMRLKELAEEDIYFAKRDMELIRALQKKQLAKLAKCDNDEEKSQAKTFEKRFEAVTDKHKKKPQKLARSYRKLLDDIKAVCKRRG